MRILFSILICAVMSGCALMTDSIDVPYQPLTAERPAAVPGAQAVTVNILGVDGRGTYRDRVSSKKNGYGMEMAAIIASNDVIETVRGAVQQELAARGYRIGPDQLQLTIEVVKFYNDFKMGFFSGDANAEVAFNVKVVGADKSLIYSKYYSGSGTEPNIALMGGDNARAALIAAMRTTIVSLVNDPDFHAAITGAGRPVANLGAGPAS